MSPRLMVIALISERVHDARIKVHSTVKEPPGSKTVTAAGRLRLINEYNER